MVGIVAAVAMLSARLAVVPGYNATSKCTRYEFQLQTKTQYNGCGDAAECSNTGTITFRPFA